jgi:predicted DNA-binding transcriptional regulator AlpA
MADRAVLVSGREELAPRPPSYVSCSTLARELDVSESTVYEMVRRGVLPQPVKLSNGCVRWCWADVQAALGSLAPGRAEEAAADPFMLGLKNVVSST